MNGLRTARVTGTVIFKYCFLETDIYDSTLEPPCLPDGSPTGEEVRKVACRDCTVLTATQAVAFFQTVVRLFKVRIILRFILL